MKLINIIERTNKEIIFQHTNEKISNKITKIYEFKYIESIDLIPIIQEYMLPTKDIISYNFNTTNQIFTENNTDNITIEFYNSLTVINQRRLFKSIIGSELYQFDVNFVINNEIYYKFFFLQVDEKYKCFKPILYLTLLNPDSGAIELLIEIGNIISVNYIHRFNGIHSFLPDDALLDFLAYLSFHFKIDVNIIHSNFNSYFNKNEIFLQYSDSSDFISQHFINLYMGDVTYYSMDFIEYLRDGIKRFNNSPDIVNIIKYQLIDEIFNLLPAKIININVTDPIFKI